MMDTYTSEQLKKEQQAILSSPPPRYGVLATMLFGVMDLLYGRARSWSKFKVLEVIARVPYQAWEQVAYIAITHSYEHEDFARRIFDRVHRSRLQQDNEQWHLFILEEWVHRQVIRESFMLHRVVPQVMAFVYYHISWLLYVIKPEWSYRMNADFEAHAEREYMLFVQEHPELEHEPFESVFKKDYGEFASMADVVRQIACDERHHKEESLALIEQARFS